MFSAICSEELEESSWYMMKTTTGNDKKKGLRLDGKEPWSPDATDKAPKIRVFMGEGRNVYIDSLRITTGSGVTGFTVIPLAIASEVSNIFNITLIMSQIK